MESFPPMLVFYQINERVLIVRFSVPVLAGAVFLCGGLPQSWAVTPVKDSGTSTTKRRGASSEADTGRRARRAIESLPTPPARQRGNQPRVMQMRVLMSGCSLTNAHRLRASLRALQNRGQLMNLEVWGDSKKYVPGQRVYFFFRSPRASYVTLFWLGPKADVVIPLRNIKIPAHQDVKIDSGGIIVPPLGREEWVAINTLEPLHFPCMLGENAVLRRLDGVGRIPHGVGKWVVDSTL